MTDISVFYNTVALPGSRHLMLEQLVRFCQTDLAQKAKNVYVMMNGDITKYLDVAMFLENNTNVRLVHTSNTHQLWEWPGLDFLKKYCDNLPEGQEEYVLYFHTKGLSRLNQNQIRDWRKYMEYWVIDRWQDCVEELDCEFDTVGTNWIDGSFLGADGRSVVNWKHYSGNFWWARASYIRRLKSLPHPDHYANGGVSEFTTYQVAPGDNSYRFDHEAWIGSGDPRASEIDSTPGGNHDNQLGHYPGWHYHHPYPESNYK